MAIRTSKRIRFTVKEYLRMDRAGVFEYKRMELLDGRIVEMHAQGDPHVATISLLTIVLARFFSNPKKDWLVVQGTYYLSKFSAPDPDFIVWDVPVGTPSKDRPLPLFVIEVANTSYKRDAGIKLRLYAQAGVEEYWIVNLAEKRIEVYREPVQQGELWTYASRSDFSGTQRATTLKRPEVTIQVNEIFAH